MPTAEQNIRRALKCLALDRSISITSFEDDAVYGWPDLAHSLFVRCIREQWVPDIVTAAQAFHGTVLAMREPGGVRPAMQVYFIPAPGAYFIGIDLDEEAPALRHPINTLRHGWRVLWKTVTRRQKDQDFIARLLDKRFGPEVADG